MATLKEQIAHWGLGGPCAGTSPDVIRPDAVRHDPSPRAQDATFPLPHPSTQEAALVVEPKPPVLPDNVDRKAYFGIKNALHQKLLTRIDLAATETMDADRLRQRLGAAAEQLIQEEALPLNEHESCQLISDLQNEILGLGPLEPLLADPSISEIMVNASDTVFVERRGRIELTDIRFNDDAHLLKIIDKIVSRVGRRIDESSPMADARLPDGSRVNAIIPPLALDGPALSIRRFASVPLRMPDLIAKGALTQGMADLLAGIVKAKINVIISGGTGSGKTTLLNILSGFIPDGERIITIEDTAELQLQQRHVVRLETRPANIEGKGGIPMRALVKNSLRMRPDRVVLGEVRGGEVIDMLQAMNTGHDGSLTTIHANAPRDALSRLENLVGMGGLSLPPKALRQQISSAIQVIVQASRLSDGSRKITSIHEITGMEGDVITSQDIFVYERQSTAADGRVVGRFTPTGVRPQFAEKLRKYGVALSEDMFDPNRSTD